MKRKIILVITVILIFAIVMAGFLIKNKESNVGQEIVTKNYKNPIVPEGFSKVETETASWNVGEDGNPIGWNNGLVIEDEEGNQFVWVPCSIDESYEIVQYARYYYKYSGDIQLSDIGTYWDENIKSVKDVTHDDWIYYYEDDAINDEIKIMVQKYGGFYIGRYEVGKEYGKAVVKSDCQVYNSITAEKALEISKNIINTENVKTYMMTSYCYGTTITWLSNTNDEFKENLSEFYNYYLDLTDGEIANTGNNDKHINNIYDFIGNVAEFTTEKCHSYNKETYVNTGTSSDNLKIIDYISTYSDLYVCKASGFEGPSELIGTRVVLVLK